MSMVPWVSYRPGTWLIDECQIAFFMSCLTELRQVASSASMLEDLIEEDSGTILGLIHLLDITNRNYGSMR